MIAHCADASHHRLTHIGDVVRCETDNTFVESSIATDVQTTTIHESTMTLNRSKHFVSIRIENHPDYWNFLFVREEGRRHIMSYTDGNNTEREAVYIVCCAVQRIDDPNPLLISNCIDRLDIVGVNKKVLPSHVPTRHLPLPKVHGSDIS